MHAHKLVHELERERECLVPPATRTKPEYKIMRSHVVVLPASTCAMMPMFRTVATARKENVRHAVASSVGHERGDLSHGVRLRIESTALEAYRRTRNGGNASDRGSTTPLPLAGVVTAAEAAAAAARRRRKPPEAREKSCNKAAISRESQLAGGEHESGTKRVVAGKNSARLLERPRASNKVWRVRRVSIRSSIHDLTLPIAKVDVAILQLQVYKSYTETGIGISNA